MSVPYKLIRPILFRMDAEKAHHLTIKALKSGLGATCGKATDDPKLRVTLWNRTFPNPVGLAAGFDKNADALTPLFKMGFGFVETGTVTPKPQHGNPKPRIFRDIDSESVINRMGFPNGGLNNFKTNIEKFLDKKPRPNGVLGLNIGMNKSQKIPAKDYVLLVRQLGPLADYLTINISSPNTPGLRDLQQREPLMDLLGQILEEREKSCGTHNPPPLLLKLAPDLDEKQQGELAGAVIDSHIDGLILTNTTLDRPEYLPSEFRNEMGGLSGPCVREKSTAVIHNFYKLTKGKVPIIGLGGISSGADAYEKIKAGASLIQIYTALIYKGPSLIQEINRDLLTLLEQDGFACLADAVGSAHKK